jgi:NitT/TauT family transport system ATP-binding protein
MAVRVSSEVGREEPSIAVSELTFWYGSNLILDDVSCTIEKGQFVSIIGASGCGKSTLLQLIDGALRPSFGRIEVDGRDATARSNSRGVVFQNFALLPWKTVLENVRLGLDYRRRDLSSAERTEIARRYIARVGLTRAEHQYPYQLSGGMQQRVGIARAFAVQPPVLLMDEPFGALDAQNAELLREDVRALVAEERRTVVFVTHNLDEALQLSDRILLMKANPGRIHEDISLVDVKRDPEAWEHKHYQEIRQRLWEFLKKDIAEAQVKELGAVA